MKIPLVRPLLPNATLVDKYLDNSHAANQWSNFGPNYHLAVQMLHTRTNRHMVPVTNGTVAIQLACQTVLPIGSRVAMPDYTHIGTYCGVRDAKMESVFLSTDICTWTISLEDLEDFKDEYDAFIVVSPFGYNVDIEPYEEFAAAENKIIIYDFAGAWGQFPDTEFPVCYSLHATKSFCTGEGGLVSFKDPNEAEICRRLTNFNTYPDGTIKEDVGANYKMDEIRLAYLCAHLEDYSKIEQRINRRKKVWAKYNQELGDGTNEIQDTPSLCVFPYMGEIDPNEIQNFFCKFYYPLLTSDMKQLNNIKRLNFSGYYFNNCLALPIDVSDDEQDIIIKEIKNALQR